MKVIVLFLSALLVIPSATGAESGVVSSVDECLLNGLKQAGSEQTVGELRERCADKSPTLVKKSR